MDKFKNKIFGLSSEDKQALISNRKDANISRDIPEISKNDYARVTKTVPAHYQFEKFTEYKQIQIQKLAANKLDIPTPYFKVHDGIAKSTTVINGKSYINYSSYDYINLAGHKAVNDAAIAAIEQYGTTVSASRPVSGERQLHQDLEQYISKLHNVEDTLLFVSGHAANVTTIGCLFGKKDLIIHDSLIHNSVIQGALLSGAKRLTFPHNDNEFLEKILIDNRDSYEKVLIVVEGLYSMEGDLPDLQKFIDLKQRYKAFIMVDEAHSLGVIGKTGRGITEHYDIQGSDIDITMGTLSKSLASCGGYIAGRKELIEILKYNAPGFVYSVGMSPPLVAAALEALKILMAEPERVQMLRANSRNFYTAAKENNLNMGTCSGHSIIPVITGNSLLTVKLSNSLFSRGINVQPIIYPAVDEKLARLRFFLSSAHTTSQIEETIEILVEEYKKCKELSIKSLF